MLHPREQRESTSIYEPGVRGLEGKGWEREREWVRIMDARKSRGGGGRGGYIKGSVQERNEKQRGGNMERKEEECVGGGENGEIMARWKKDDSKWIERMGKIKER